MVVNWLSIVDCLNLSIKIDTHIQILVNVVDFHRFLSIIDRQIMKEGTSILTKLVQTVCMPQCLYNKCGIGGRSSERVPWVNGYCNNGRNVNPGEENW